MKYLKDTRLINPVQNKLGTENKKEQSERE